MARTFKPVDAPKSAIKVKDSDITDTDKTEIEEAISYSLEHPRERMLVEYGTADERDTDRAKIRFVSNARTPRVVASVWDKSKPDATPPVFALSVAWTVKTDAE